MKKFSLFVAVVFGLSFFTIPKAATAAWVYDPNIFSYSSNICRNGYYWQFVHWGYVGTDCYMPMWNGWGKRVIE